MTTLQEKKEEVKKMVFVPSADVFEKENTITIILDIPGADENTVDIELLEQGKLKVSAKTTYSETKDDHKVLHSEYYVGNFERTFVLPDRVDVENINAVVKDGVLTLTIPRKKEAEPKKIVVRSA